MDILEFIKSRRSTRKFTDKEIEAEKLNQILEAGRYAPSGGNSQSTHFLVIQNNKNRQVSPRNLSISFLHNRSSFGNIWNDYSCSVFTDAKYSYHS